MTKKTQGEMQKNIDKAFDKVLGNTFVEVTGLRPVSPYSSPAVEDAQMAFRATYEYRSTNKDQLADFKLIKKNNMFFVKAMERATAKNR